MFENYFKNLIQHCRAKRAAFSVWVEKFIKIPKMFYFGDFWKSEASNQTVLPVRLPVDKTKLMKNAKIEKFRCDILSDFQTLWLGAILSGAVWDDDIQTFPMELERNGDYFIGYTYKVWAPGLSLNAPMGGTRTQYQRAGGHFSHFSHWVTCNAKKYGSIEAAKNVLYQETRDNFLQFLDGWKEVKSGSQNKPFMYWWGPTNTHR